MRTDKYDHHVTFTYNDHFLCSLPL